MWWKDFQYPWWARLLAALLVLLSTFPIPVWFFKNWPKNGFSATKENLSNTANFSLDPSWKQPERRVSMSEMEKTIRAEDKVLLKKALAEGGDMRFKA